MGMTLKSSLGICSLEILLTKIQIGHKKQPADPPHANLTLMALHNALSFVLSDQTEAVARFSKLSADTLDHPLFEASSFTVPLQ